MYTTGVGCYRRNSHVITDSLWLSRLKKCHVIYPSEMFLYISAMVFITVTDTRLNARMSLDKYNL